MSAPAVATLPPDLRRLVEAEVEPGEVITWAAQPIVGRIVRRTLPVMLMGIPFTAFAILWTVVATSLVFEFGGVDRMASVLRILQVLGVLFVLMGVGLMLSPLWAGRSARWTVYALTDRRAILFLPRWTEGFSVRSFGRSSLGDLRRDQQDDGSGDLVFTEDPRTDSGGHRMARDVGFMAIPDVRAVEAMVRALTAERPGSVAGAMESDSGSRRA